MNITITGMGYVGLVTAACLAEIGHKVIGFDRDKNKITSLLHGKLTIYEPGLKELIDKNVINQRLTFTSEPLAAYKNPECVFITVGTPLDKEGSIDLSSLFDSIQTLMENLQTNTILAIKSTVPVGTCEQIQKMVNNSTYVKRKVNVVSNPEFLREGSGIHDTFHADRIIIGTEDEYVKELFNNLYHPFRIPIVFTEMKSAELIKYAANAFLATKISFINEIANICELSGADIEEVANGIGLDNRIGRAFLNAGIGYGGSCFPKDTRALNQYCEQKHYHFDILKATINVNEKRKLWPIFKLKKLFTTLNGLEIAILGLSFKPFTDDLRGAPSIDITKKLLEEKAEITVFDPIASTNFKQLIPNIKVAYSIEDAIKNKQAVVILTEWPEIQSFDIHKFRVLMKTPIVIDGRNCYKIKKAEKESLSYYSIGRLPVNPIN